MICTSGTFIAFRGSKTKRSSETNQAIADSGRFRSPFALKVKTAAKNKAPEVKTFARNAFSNEKHQILNAPENGASFIGQAKGELSTGWPETNHPRADSDPLRSSHVLSVNDEAQIRPNSGKSMKIAHIIQTNQAIADSGPLRSVPVRRVKRVAIIRPISRHKIRYSTDNLPPNAQDV